MELILVPSEQCPKLREIEENPLKLNSTQRNKLPVHLNVNCYRKWPVKCVNIAHKTEVPFRLIPIKCFAFGLCRTEFLCRAEVLLKSQKNSSDAGQLRLQQQSG